MNKEIGIIIVNLGAGGAEKLLSCTIPEYHNNGFKIRLYVINQNGEKKEYYNAIKNHCEFISLGFKSAYNPLVLFAIIRIMRRESLLHVHLFPTNFWVAFANFIGYKNCKILNTEHGIVNSNIIKSWPKRMLLKFIYSRFDLNIAITKGIKEKVASLVSSEVKTIYNGFNIEEYQAIPKYSKTTFCQEQNISVDLKLLLMVSRLHPGKRHDTVLHALSRLPESIHLLFIGIDKLPNNLLEIVNENNLEKRIHLLGFKENVLQYMKMVDVNILASDSEGMSGVIVESLIAGKPILGSKVDGIAELLHSPNDSFSTEKELSEKVLELVSNEKEYNARSVANELHAQRFSLDKMVCEHIGVYENFLTKTAEQTF